MALPALATLEQYQARYPGTLTEPQQAQVTAFLADAAAMIRARTHFSWVTGEGEDQAIADPVATTVCIASARRAFLNPDGTTQRNIAGYGDSRDVGQVGVWLTEGELDALEAARDALPSRNTGIGTLATTRGPIETGSLCTEVVAMPDLDEG